MNKILIDLDEVREPKKSYSYNTLKNMKKEKLIEYVRTLEYNLDVSTCALNQQSNNMKDLKQIKYGKWIDVTEQYVTCDTILECSCCGWKFYINDYQPYDFNYCPDCGARMESEILK